MYTKIIDFISENVYKNTLYSWISTNKIKDIVYRNIIFGGFKHTLKNKDIFGNSFSRNKFLVIDNYRVKIEVDKDLIKNRYKIIPLDGEIIHRKVRFNDIWKYNKYKDRNPKKTNVFGDQPINKDFHIHRFDEEFIIGDIKDVSKYITKVIVYPKKWNSEILDDDLLKDLIEYCEKNNIILEYK